MIMKNSMTLVSSWFVSDSRRIRVALIGLTGIAILLGLNETAFAGSATIGVH
jgi:hypothetical protein